MTTTPTTPPATPSPSTPTPPKSNSKLLLFGGGGGCAALLLLICVCSGIFMIFHTSNPLLGKWKLKDAPVVAEFKSDGTCTLMDETGTYTTSGNKLTITHKSAFGGATVSDTSEFEVHGSELTITTTEGGMSTSMKFTRQ